MLNMRLYLGNQYTSMGAVAAMFLTATSATSPSAWDLAWCT